jgi:hypothetical protein
MSRVLNGIAATSEPDPVTQTFATRSAKGRGGYGKTPPTRGLTPVAIYPSTADFDAVL